MEKRVQKIHQIQTPEWIYRFWAWQLLAWSLYRYFIHVPEWVDECIAKPLVFVFPVLWWVFRKEQNTFSSIGITKKNIRTSIFLGIGIGAVFLVMGLVANMAKYGSIVVHPIQAVSIYGVIGLLILSLITAFIEELLNRGFLFSRLFTVTKHLWYSVGMSGVLFVLFHVPVLVTSLKFEGAVLVTFFFSTFLLGVMNALSYAATSSLLAPILIHFFWNITVALFL